MITYILPLLFLFVDIRGDFIRGDFVLQQIILFSGDFVRGIMSGIRVTLQITVFPYLCKFMTKKTDNKLKLNTYRCFTLGQQKQRLG